MAGSIGSNTLNIGGADPIQGYDVGVWVNDTSTQQRVLLGQFTSIVVTIRNATEAYMEMGQRYPRYLDGEFQIAYVMEKGLLDLNVFQQTFGFKYISRTKRFGRSPRFDITFAVNPVDADVLEGTVTNAMDNTGAAFNRDVTGRFILVQCKVDSWHFAATSGRQVVATQWQGVSEGFAAVTSDYSEIQGLKSPYLKNDNTFAANFPGGKGATYKSFEDGIASTPLGSHSDTYIAFGDNPGSNAGSI